MTEANPVRTDGTIIQVGDRVLCENHRAIVCYAGLVPPTKGFWLGVEWDDPKRGRHDGSYEGKLYFHTSHPTAGSFVRPSKVSGGINAVQAVHERYGLKNDEQAGVKNDELFVLDQYLNQTKVEMVGAKKVNQQQSQFSKLKKISMFDMAVYSAGSQGELGRLCPRITDLDVSRSLLTSWEKVAEVTVQLPHLKDLNVSENLLVLPKDPTSLSESFIKLKNVTMNKMQLNWKEILACCSMFPVLEELHAGFNNLATLEDSTHVLKGLRVLDLMTNCIEDWVQILKLGTLPFLEILIVSENKIKTIVFPDCSPTCKTSLFTKLKALIIKHNELSEWSSINELNKLQQLEELQIADNPILKTFNYETCRQLCVAKIHSLKLISRTPITFEERKGAEIDYTKRFGIEWKKEGGSSDNGKSRPSEAFVTNHPRFQEIVEKWGAPEDSELGEKSTALKDNLVAVKIVSAAHPQKGTLSKKLPMTMSVEKLKTLIQRLYKMHSEPRLTYTSHKKTDGPQIELDNDMRQLGFFAIEAGDTIHVAW